MGLNKNSILFWLIGLLTHALVSTIMVTNLTLRNFESLLTSLLVTILNEHSFLWIKPVERYFYFFEASDTVGIALALHC